MSVASPTLSHSLPPRVPKLSLILFLKCLYLLYTERHHANCSPTMQYAFECLLCDVYMNRRHPWRQRGHFCTDMQSKLCICCCLYLPLYLFIFFRKWNTRIILIHTFLLIPIPIDILIVLLTVRDWGRSNAISDLSFHHRSVRSGPPCQWHRHLRKKIPINKL